jgi:4-amino-4-deoxy-L-arabinose transferase-like glycosyltransferase
MRPSRALWGLMLLVGAAHVTLNLVTPFGVHRDEFLYLAMGDHLRLWRMDFPPFIAVVANATRALFGDALWAIRLGPALVSAVLIGLAGWSVVLLCDGEAHERESPSFAPSLLAALAAVCAPVLQRPGQLFQPVVFDQLWWTLALLALAMRVARDDARWWVAVGAALGLGLLTKFSIAFIGVGIVVGVLATPLRRDLATRWPWVALVVALGFGLPSLVGQVALDWPLRWQLRDLAASQLTRRSVFAFVSEQPLQAGPLGFLLAMVGLWWLLRTPRVRALGIAVVVSWVWLSVQRGKGYYGAPVYPLLFGAGAVALSEWSRRVTRWLVPTYAALMAAFAVLVLPVALPILSPARTAAYAARLGVGEATRTNYGTTLALPQDFADMLGWEAQADAVAEEWRALTSAERAVAVLAADSYGHAGLLDYYGPSRGLPRVVSGAGSCWYFGPGEKRGDILLVLGDGPEALAPLFAQCRLLRTVGTAWGVEEEHAVPITRCDGPRGSLQANWPRFAPFLD